MGRITTWDSNAPSAAYAGFHSSHHMMYKGGIWWCSKCGSFSVRSGDRVTARLLKGRCAGHPAVAGAYQLRRLRRGRPPRPNLSWTEDISPDAKWIPKHRLRAKTSLHSSPPPAVQSQQQQLAPGVALPCDTQEAQEPQDQFAEQDPFGFAQLHSFQ